MATLVIFSGLPCVGKSTLAKAICQETGAVYLPIDTIALAMNDFSSSFAAAASYHLCNQLAEDNLKLGHHVVVDCCNPTKKTRAEWCKIASRNKAAIHNVKVTCADKEEHKKRVEARISNAAGQFAPTWQQVMTANYEEWELPAIEIDTSHGKILTSVFELMSKVSWE